MLYSINAGSVVKKLPHNTQYRKWMLNISDYDYSAIIQELNNRINCDEIHTAGWMPGSIWTDTEFEPIYNACGKNYKKAALFFGLIVFKVFMDRDDYWGFGKYEKDGIPIHSITYYRLTNVNTLDN